LKDFRPGIWPRKDCSF